MVSRPLPKWATQIADRVGTSSRVNRVHAILLNGARPRALLTMIIGTFGVGFAAGILTTQLSEGRAPEGPPAAAPPGRAMAALPAVGGAPAADAPAPDGFLPGTWLSSDGGSAALPPLAAQLSVAETVEALARPARVGALALPGPRIDGLASDAEVGQQARLAKASLDRPWSTEQIVVRPGDTLMDILNRAQIDLAEAHAATEALRAVYDPRRLRAGQELAITAAMVGRSDDTRRALLGFAFDPSFDHQIRVTRSTDGRYDAAKIERPQHREMVRRAGTIDDSLYLAAERVALPQDVTFGLIKLFSWDVDFQRDLRPGDGFEAMFEEVSLEDGSGAVRGGPVLYAGLTLSGGVLDAYRFELEDGDVEYFDRTGRSLRKFLLRTPVDGARLSSGFGMRRHPILGYSRMHKGVDFAAPSGTPIYAAGSGRVASAGRNGGYGNYIQIRHSGEYSTAYAHLSRFAKGIRPGARVQQGQVIGYVGTTGRSTGPHLHYEVLRNASQINPLSVKQPPNTQLAGANLKRFQAEVGRIDQLRAELARGTQLASRSDAPHAAN
jgi:murein DD-endopeptidase MepM/ murein hydrolase activator NlpD